jgi:hypothetical protein
MAKWTARSVAECLLPVLPTAVVVTLFVWFMTSFGIQKPLDFDVTTIAPPVGFHAQSAAAVARISWAVTSAVFLFVCLAVTLCSLRLVIVPIGPGAERWRWVVGAAALLATIPIFADQKRALSISGLIPVLQKSFDALDLKHGRLFMGLFPALAFAGAAIVLFSACTTLAPPEGGDEAEYLRGQMARLRTVLYLGAALLVTGTLQNTAMHQIPVALIDGPQAADLGNVARAVCAATGTFWTLLLAAVYTPCALTLRYRAADLARRENPAQSMAEQSKWLARHDLSVSFGQGAKHVIAVLGPLLAGLPSSMLLQALGGGPA